MEGNHVIVAEESDDESSYTDASSNDDEGLMVLPDEDISDSVLTDDGLLQSDRITQHTYLGSMEEIHGRTLLDENSVMELPVIIHVGYVGVPGQTLPLTVNRPQVVNMLRRIIAGDHIFGILTYRSYDRNASSPEKIGTTAEIFEYGEYSDTDISFRLKARIRQRFKVIEIRRQIDGTSIAKVQILPEKLLPDSLFEPRSTSLDRFRSTPLTGLDSYSESVVSQYKLYKKQYKIPYSPWPCWIYKSYDLLLVSQRVLDELKRTIFVDSETVAIIPRDPIDLSYWIIQNLPLEDSQRLQLLAINNPNQRLRAELSILQKCQVLCCRECDHAVARQTDVFSMSKEGPQGAYVNPFGHVHETLTVHKADGIRVITPPSTEFSWFPGYSWAITECAYCRNHMGWLFTATKNHLRPTKFWGLCRGSLKPLLKIDDEDGKFTLVM